MRTLALAPLLAVLTVPGPVGAQAYDHVHLTAPDAAAAVAWYEEHVGCEGFGRADACRVGGVSLIFFEREPTGGSVGSGVDHIGFSYEDLQARMDAWKAAGVTVLSDVRDVEGLFKLAFIEDPWGTKIEVVEDLEDLGFHHVHLTTPDPEATLAWYGEMFGGVDDRMKGRLSGVRFGRVWLLASRLREGELQPTQGRALDHLGWRLDDLDGSAAEMRAKGAQFSMDPRDFTDPLGDELRISFLTGPDGVRIEAVERPR